MSRGAAHFSTRRALIDLAKLCEQAGNWTDAHKWRAKALRRFDIADSDDASFFAINAPDLAREYAGRHHPAGARKRVHREATRS